jgi:hypothetical protein
MAVRTSGAAGALMWSIVPHADGAGFVDHADGFQFFVPGRTADEVARAERIVAALEKLAANASPVAT